MRNTSPEWPLCGQSVNPEYQQRNEYFRSDWNLNRAKFSVQFRQVFYTQHPNPARGPSELEETVYFGYVDDKRYA